jgi:hypothetical protein
MVYCTFFFAFFFFSFSVSVEERNFGFACVALALGSAQLSACNKPIKREGGMIQTVGEKNNIFEYMKSLFCACRFSIVRRV